METHALRPDRGGTAPRWLLTGFIAGFIAVIVFHQGALGALHASGLAPRPPYSFAPTNPFGVPQLWSIAFWGGVWGVILAAALGRLTGARLVVAATIFGAIERQLKKTVALRRHEEKSHNGEPRGIVEKLFGDEGYGFIRTLEGDRQFYFHKNSVLHDDFERLAVGTEVRFTPQEGEKGPQASSVQVVGKPGSATAA